MNGSEGMNIFRVLSWQIWFLLKWSFKSETGLQQIWTTTKKDTKFDPGVQMKE